LGFVYDVKADAVTDVATRRAPVPRSGHTAVWTGDRMLVWGGVGQAATHDALYPSDVGTYDPATNSWAASAPDRPGAPHGRVRHSAVWTGSEMLVWGGGTAYWEDSIQRDDGAAYNPSTDSWRPLPASGLSPRFSHTAVWTGTEMLVWGGTAAFPAPNETIGDTFLYAQNGARFDPQRNSWRPISTLNAPSTRGAHTAIWTGSKMIVWGGEVVNSRAGELFLRDGGIYDPQADAWTAITPPDDATLPLGRSLHEAVWTGSEMCVLGGYDGSKYNGRVVYHETLGQMEIDLNGNDSFPVGLILAAACLDPSTNAWRALPTDGVPPGRTGHVVVFAGGVIAMFGGRPSPFAYNGFIGDLPVFSVAGDRWIH
jgi:N-acetylneuraminic acid mutarotase